MATEWSEWMVDVCTNEKEKIWTNVLLTPTTTIEGVIQELELQGVDIADKVITTEESVPVYS